MIGRRELIARRPTNLIFAAAQISYRPARSARRDLERAAQLVSFTPCTCRRRRRRRQVAVVLVQRRRQ